jgi:hypothetical protein
VHSFPVPTYPPSILRQFLPAVTSQCKYFLSIRLTSQCEQQIGETGLQCIVGTTSISSGPEGVLLVGPNYNVYSCAGYTGGWRCRKFVQTHESVLLQERKGRHQQAHWWVTRARTRPGGSEGEGAIINSRLVANLQIFRVVHRVLKSKVTQNSA